MNKVDQAESKVSGGKIVRYVVCILLCFLSIFPFYILIINSTLKSTEIVTGIKLIPGGEFIANFKGLLAGSEKTSGVNVLQALQLWKPVFQSLIRLQDQAGLKYLRCLNIPDAPAVRCGKCKAIAIADLHGILALYRCHTRLILYSSRIGVFQNFLRQERSCAVMDKHITMLIRTLKASVRDQLQCPAHRVTEIHPLKNQAFRLTVPIMPCSRSFSLSISSPNF